MKFLLKFLFILTPWLMIILFFLNFNTYFYNRFENYQVYKNFNNEYSTVEINQKFTELMDYINWRRDNLDQNFFSEEDRLHLQDVKSIIATVYIMSIISIIALVHSFNTDNKNKWDSLRFSSIINIIVVSILGSFAVLNFSNAFILFHKVLFRNDYWMLDPQSSNLIKYFPEQIFLEIAIYILLFVIISSILGLIIWKQQIKKYLSQEDT